jgi:hypothetical protein
LRSKLQSLFRRRVRRGDTGHAIVINTFANEPVGFILTDFSVDPSHDGSYEGDCVFMIMPASAAISESSLCDTLFSYKDAREHNASLTVTGGKREYTIFGSNLPVLRISTDGEGQGTLVQKGTEDEPIANIICLSPEGKGVA